MQMGKNIAKHVKASAKGNDIITFVISANQHLASTLLMQIFRFQRRGCKLSFVFLPHHQGAPSLRGSRKKGRERWREKSTTPSLIPYPLPLLTPATQARAPQRACSQATSYRLYSRYLWCLAKIMPVDYEVEQN